MLPSPVFDKGIELDPVIPGIDRQRRDTVIGEWKKCEFLSKALFSLFTKRTTHGKRTDDSQLRQEFIVYRKNLFYGLFNTALIHQRTCKENKGNGRYLQPRTACPKTGTVPVHITFLAGHFENRKLASIFVHIGKLIKTVGEKKLYECVELCENKQPSGEYYIMRDEWRWSNRGELIQEQKRIRKAKSEGILRMIFAPRCPNHKNRRVVTARLPHTLQQMEQMKIPANTRLQILVRIVKTLCDLHGSGQIVGGLSLDEIEISYEPLDVKLSNLGKAEKCDVEDDEKRWIDLWAVNSILSEILPDQLVETLPAIAQGVLSWLQQHLVSDVNTPNIIPTKQLLAVFKLCRALVTGQPVDKHWKSVDRLYQLEILGYWDVEADQAVDKLMQSLGEQRSSPQERAGQRWRALCGCDAPSIEELLPLAPHFCKVEDREKLAAYLEDHPGLSKLPPLTKEAVGYFSTSDLDYKNGTALLQLAQSSLTGTFRTSQMNFSDPKGLFLHQLLKKGDLSDPDTQQVSEVLIPNTPQSILLRGEVIQRLKKSPLAFRCNLSLACMRHPTLSLVALITCLIEAPRSQMINKAITELNKTSPDMELVRTFLYFAAANPDSPVIAIAHRINTSLSTLLLHFLHRIDTKDPKEAEIYLQAADGDHSTQLLSLILNECNLTDPGVMEMVLPLLRQCPKAFDLLDENRERILKEPLPLRLKCVKAIIPRVTEEQLNRVHKLVILWLQPRKDNDDTAKGKEHTTYSNAITLLEQSLFLLKSFLDQMRIDCVNYLDTALNCCPQEDVEHDVDQGQAPRSPHASNATNSD